MKALLLMVSIVLLSSCSSIFCGARKSVVFDANIPKVQKLEIDGNVYSNVTFPFATKVRRGFYTTYVKGEAEGYSPLMIQVNKDFNPVSVINLFNVLGWAIDAATGAMMQPEFTRYYLDFSVEKD